MGNSLNELTLRRGGGYVKYNIAKLIVVLVVIVAALGLGALGYALQSSHNDGVIACKARGFVEYDVRGGMLCLDPKTRALYAP